MGYSVSADGIDSGASYNGSDGEDGVSRASSTYGGDEYTVASSYTDSVAVGGVDASDDSVVSIDYASDSAGGDYYVEYSGSLVV